MSRNKIKQKGKGASEIQAGSINTLLHGESLLNWSLVLTEWR